MRDAIVIGSGLAGLTAALRLAKGGKTVSLISKGPGGLQLSQGTFDILGYSPDRVSDPLDAVGALAKTKPEHPYAAHWWPTVPRIRCGRSVRRAMCWIRSKARADPPA